MTCPPSPPICPPVKLTRPLTAKLPVPPMLPPETLNVALRAAVVVLLKKTWPAVTSVRSASYVEPALKLTMLLPLEMMRTLPATLEPALNCCATLPAEVNSSQELAAVVMPPVCSPLPVSVNVPCCTDMAPAFCTKPERTVRLLALPTLLTRLPWLIRLPL